MLHNINWDVCPDWVRFLNREAKPKIMKNIASRRQSMSMSLPGTVQKTEAPYINTDLQGYRLVILTPEEATASDLTNTDF